MKNKFKGKKRIGIVKIELAYPIPNGVNAENYLCNMELPSGYVEDSFDIVGIIKNKIGKITI